MSEHEDARNVASVVMIDVPERCARCGATPDEWPLAVHGGLLHLSCPKCYTVTAPVVAVREPWCNHDPAAVVDGICECGKRVG